MYVSSRRLSVVGALLGLFLLLSWTYWSRSTYTVSLQSRPFMVGIIGYIKTLDPALVTTHQEKLAASTIYEGLVRYDESTGTVRPNLAQDWKISSDGKEISITLKRNVRFHNGKRLEASDVKDSWELSFDKTKWDRKWLFSPIAGSKERLNGKAKELAGVRVVDEDTLKITLDRPDAAFVSSLTNPVFWIRDTEDRGQVLAGTGPFKFQELANGKVTVTRYDRYHRGRAKLGEIQFISYSDVEKAWADYTAKKLDYLDEVPLAKVKEIRTSTYYHGLFTVKPVQAIYALGFNVNREPFADNHYLRRALNYAVDRQTIIDNINGGLGVPMKGAYPMGLAGYDRGMSGYDYDPERARELLEEAGYPDGQGLPTLTLVFNESPGHRRVAEAVAAQLANVGISVKLQGVAWEQYLKGLTNCSYPFFRLGWEADYPDIDGFLYPLYYSQNVGIGNFTGYSNPQVDKIIDTARSETVSSRERLNLMRRAEAVIVDDAPMLWLYQREAFKMIGKEVRGFKLNTMEMVDWLTLELETAGS